MKSRKRPLPAFLRIYPALDGSEADVVDRVPFHWHTESEIVIVDVGRFRLS